MSESQQMNISYRGPSKPWSKTLENNEAKTPWNRFTLTLLVTWPKPLQQHRKKLHKWSQEGVLSVFLLHTEKFQATWKSEIQTKWGIFVSLWHISNNIHLRMFILVLSNEYKFEHEQHSVILLLKKIKMQNWVFVFPLAFISSQMANASHTKTLRFLVILKLGGNVPQVQQI